MLNEVHDILTSGRQSVRPPEAVSNITYTRIEYNLKMDFGWTVGFIGHFTDHCCMVVSPVTVFTNLLVTASIGSRSPSSGFPNYSRASASATLDPLLSPELGTHSMQLSSAVNNSCRFILRLTVSRIRRSRGFDGGRPL